MFTEHSRYAKTPTETVSLPDGQEGTVLRLRPLPSTGGEPHRVRDRDQLDILAHERTGDGTRFWHVADANTEIEARRLLDETGRVIRIPKD